MPLVVTTPTRYGPLQEDFSFQLGDGYQVFVGKNNSGKSAILQLAFKTAMRAPDVGADRVALLMPERSYVDISAETGGQNLAQFNNNLLQLTDGQTLGYNAQSLPMNSVARLLLNHTDYRHQLGRLDGLLERMGFPKLVLRESQALFFEDVRAHFQGAGLRSILPILAALTDDRLRFLFIDEPEANLEPGVQKALRDVLIDEAGNKLICAATHSHLFLNRSAVGANVKVLRDGDIVSAGPLTSEAELYETTFALLGSDTQDLFFPGNYMIVEGASDQVVCEKVLEAFATGGGSATSRMPYGRVGRQKHRSSTLKSSAISRTLKRQVGT